VATDNPQAHRFTFNLGDGPFADPSIPFPIYRGWASVDAEIDGLELRFASTHLEPADLPDGSIVPALEQLQRLQAGELAASIGTDLPVVSVGDYNTDAYGASTATYADLLAYGFEDAWSQSGDGMTCCQTEDLSLRKSIRDRRVDLIMLRGDFGLLEPGIQGAVSTRILGSRIADLTDTGLWPSDHSGVLATMRLPRRN
jgi:endonuclease/exonuclease/phosphatase family metal-dependent hydrolase